MQWLQDILGFSGRYFIDFSHLFALEIEETMINKDGNEQSAVKLKEKFSLLMKDLRIVRGQAQILKQKGQSSVASQKITKTWSNYDDMNVAVPLRPVPSSGLDAKDSTSPSSPTRNRAWGTDSLHMMILPVINSALMVSR
jgi:hypothetical protein